jgi:hypothetical protein
MKKPTLGALALSLLLTPLAGCFVVVDDDDTEGQFSVSWSFQYGGQSQNLDDACADLGVNKFDLRTVDTFDNQVRYFRYDCDAGSVVTSPALPEGDYQVFVELRFDNDSDPTNGPSPLFGPTPPANNANCGNGVCAIYGGEISSIGQFIFDIPSTQLAFTGRFDNTDLTLSANCGGQGGSAQVSTQVVNFFSGNQTIAAPISGLENATPASARTGESNECQERNTVMGINAVLFPGEYSMELLGFNSGGQECYDGVKDFDVVGFAGGPANLGPIVATYNGCTLPKR